MLIKTKKERKRIIHYTAEQEAAMDRKMDNHFKSQRELKNGRHFLWDTFRFRSREDNEAFRNNFDKIRFPTTPPGHGI